MTTRYYITTTIPYVNAAPHLGHALELVQADIVARFLRLCGCDVTFQTGTDENALKNVIAAEEAGVDPATYVSFNAQRFKDLTDALDISVDTFVRTSDERHRHSTEWFWNHIKTQDLYQAEYEGLYCRGCEEFVSHGDLINGVCPEHETKPEAIKERNWFFRLSAYQNQLLRLIESGTMNIVPKTRKNEVTSFIRRGLQDICVSRDASRSKGWGIPVPNDSSQVIYVWIDALINYLSGRGYGTEYINDPIWNSSVRKVHVLGKDIWKFHAVYWPALLISAGFDPPDELFVHGFLTVEGRKISKSLGNAVDPLTYIRHYQSDAIRWYLASEISPFADGDVSRDRLHTSYNSFLASGIGNLINRVLTLCQRAEVPGYANRLPKLPADIKSEFRKYVEGYAIDRYSRGLTSLLSVWNSELQAEAPWKNKGGDISALRESLARWRDRIAVYSQLMSPIVPKAAEKASDALIGVRVKNPGALFPRIDG